jgi:hypothetical protein
MVAQAAEEEVELLQALLVDLDRVMEKMELQILAAEAAEKHQVHQQSLEMVVQELQS